MDFAVTPKTLHQGFIWSKGSDPWAKFSLRVNTAQQQSPGWADKFLLAHHK